MSQETCLQSISDAIKNGRAKGVGTITNALFESAVKGSVPAQIFYLKNRDQENGVMFRRTTSLLSPR